MSAQMTPEAHLRHAVNVDRDDPFRGARMASQLKLMRDFTEDFTRTRRQPSPLHDRFHLIRGR
jgi:hypothetical protein